MTVVETPSGTQHQPNAGAATSIPKPHHKHLVTNLPVQKNHFDPKTMSTTNSTTGWEFTKRMMQQHQILRSHPLLTRILLSGIKAFLTGYTITFLPQLLKLLLQVRRLKEQVFWKMVAVMVKSARAPLPRFFLVLFGGCRVVEVGVAGVEGWARQKGWITFGEKKPETEEPMIARAAEGEEPLKVGVAVETEEVVQVPPSVEVAVEEEASTQTEREDTKHRHLLPRISPHVSFLSAFVSSLVAIHTLPRSHRTSIALFTLVRCIDALLSYHATTLKSKLNRYLPAFISTHLDTITFITCCTQIMQSWFYYPSALPKSYVHWINKMSHMDARVLKALRLLGHGTMRYGEDTGHAHLVGDFAEEIGLDRAMGDPVNGLVPCLIVHQGREGCVNQWGWVWRTGFLDALKIYIPVHILPTLLFHPHLFRPHLLPKTLPHLLLTILRSSTFLSTFILFQWIPICIARNTFQNDSMLGPTLGAFLSGFSILLEKKKRRREIALYCIPKAVEATWWRCVHNKSVSSGGAVVMGVVGRNGEGVAGWVFAMAMAGLVTMHRCGADKLRPAVRGLLGFFLV